jgi:hypothetical protein
VELDKVTGADFRPFIGSDFEIRFDDGTYHLRLVAVDDLQAWEGQQRLGFSLTFSGEKKAVLPQGTWKLEHGQAGPLEIFLVPIQPDADGPRYEAIFN